MIIEAFGKQKNIMDWLEDSRIHPEVTRDVLVKRIKRGTDPESAITTPVIKGASVGDTKVRVSAREDKMKHRVRMFKLAQSIRKDFDNGNLIEDIMENYGVSKSQVNKIGGKMEWYNVHWDRRKTPDIYKKYLNEEVVLDDDERISA